MKLDLILEVKKTTQVIRKSDHMGKFYAVYNHKKVFRCISIVCYILLHTFMNSAVFNNVGHINFSKHTVVAFATVIAIL